MKNSSGKQTNPDFMNRIIVKMAHFFNQLAEECFTQVQSQEGSQLYQNLQTNKKQLKNFEETPTNEENTEQNPVKESRLEKQESLKNIISKKPKHPISNYIIFFREKGQEIAKEKGEVLGSKIAKLVADTWKGMSAEQKEPYQILAKQEQRKYEKEKTEYNVKYANQIEKIKKYKKTKRMKRKEEEEKVQLEEFNKVVKPRKGQSKRQREQEQKEESSVASYVDSEENQSDLDLKDDMSNSIEQEVNIQKGKLFQDLIQPEKEKSQVQKEDENAKREKEEREDKELLDQIEMPDCELDQTIPENLDDILLSAEFQESQILRSQISPKITEDDADEMIELSLSKKSQDGNNLNQSLFETEQIILPKSPVSSFFIFYKLKGRELSEKTNIPRGPKLIKICADFWKKMDPSQKKIYTAEAKKSQVNYYKELEQLKQKHGNDAIVKRRRQRGQGKPGRKKSKLK